MALPTSSLLARYSTHYLARIVLRGRMAAASDFLLPLSSRHNNSSSFSTGSPSYLANSSNGTSSSSFVHLPTPYELAVARLNLLQSNSATLQKMKDKKANLQETNLPEAFDCLRRAGIELSQLDSLHIIHVTGTKGKGSTCAYVESILRAAGLKTGFFSSPHVVHVRERIRLNGEPLSEDSFAHYLLPLHHTLSQTAPGNDTFPLMPAYFKFLTIMAFDVFLKEKVDVAIIEVGIGGEYDCTNIIQHPVVCGITTLDYDHIAILGSTLKEIAWNKAGILKKDSEAFVSEGQTEESLEVITQRAVEKQTLSLSVCPPLDDYQLEGTATKIQGGIRGEHQKVNLSLALQIARTWLLRERPQLESRIFEDTHNWKKGLPFTIPTLIQNAVAKCHWPGRSQILQFGKCRFFLDGAHTVKSMKSCVDWYQSEVEGGEKRPLFLLFHCTGDRHPEALLVQLESLLVSGAFFCPPLSRPRPIPLTSDFANYYRPPDEQTRQSRECERAWRELRTIANGEAVIRVDSIEEALAEIREQADHIDKEVDVLVTGSLILVGGVLAELAETKA